jgi:serine/threonine protein kinase
VRTERVIVTNNKTFIVMEQMSGSVRDEVDAKSHLAVDSVQLLAYQMLLALEYLHSINIIHRDIKPANILTSKCSITNQTKYKLADFGLSRIFSWSQAVITRCGTSVYMAPEIENVNRQEGYTAKVDIWSLGASLYFW